MGGPGHGRVEVEGGAEFLLTQEAGLLEAIARGAPLDATLYRVARLMEGRVPAARCAVGVQGADGGLRVRAAPTLDRETVLALDRLAPGSDLGRAMAEAPADVVSFDCVTTDDRWADLVATSPSIAGGAAWWVPVTVPGTAHPLGALLVFHDEARPPRSDEVRLLRRLRHVAAIAIERRNFEAALEHQALYDQLTDLPNRSLLLDRIDQALARASRHRTRIAVLFLDIDRFKVINDSLGHTIGDRLLVKVAARLQEPLRLGDTVGRLGGDEFLVVCERVESEEEAVMLADRLVTHLAQPFALDDTEIVVTASIGVALSGEGPTSGEALVRNADMAMYKAKERGRARPALFDQDLALRVVERHEVGQSLRTALDEAQFELHYQPLVRLDDGGIGGVEALVRWKRPDHGLVEPAAFIPLAEENGMIVPIGRWVMQQACRHAATWPPLPDGSLVQVTVNLSARQLAAPEFVDEVDSLLGDIDLDPTRLCCEITESVLVDDLEGALSTLDKLKALGVMIAIDDFGTGYATLEYLRRFTMADFLKIDRSFIDGVDTGGSKEMAIVAGAIALAKSLGLTVVAEGVETQGQLAALRGLGCDLAQGFFFSRPLPHPAAFSLLGEPPHWLD